MKSRTQFYIDGEWIEPSTNQALEVINPATEKIIGSVAAGNQEDVDKAVAAAKSAFDSYSRTSREERVELVGKHHRSLQGSFR